LIADGLYPSNLEKGYILRRILRRLTLALKFLEIELSEIEKLIKAVVEKYSSFYPELKNFDKIKGVILEEITNFERTLSLGLKEFNKLIKDNKSESKLGEKLFFLYTSYGLPLEISKELLKDHGLVWEKESQEIFDELFKKHQEISKG